MEIERTRIKFLNLKLDYRFTNSRMPHHLTSSKSNTQDSSASSLSTQSVLSTHKSVFNKLSEPHHRLTKPGPGPGPIISTSFATFLRDSDITAVRRTCPDHPKPAFAVTLTNTSRNPDCCSPTFKVNRRWADVAIAGVIRGLFLMGVAIVREISRRI